MKGRAMVIGNAIVLFGLVLGMLMAQFMLLSLNNSDNDGQISDDDDNAITGFAIDGPQGKGQGQPEEESGKKAVDIDGVLPDKITIDSVLAKGDHSADAMSASETKGLPLKSLSSPAPGAGTPKAMVTEFVKVCDIYSYGVIRRDNLACAIDEGYAILAHLYELLFESWKEN